MFTVIETPTFSSLAADYLTVDERGELAATIAADPTHGAVIRNSGGIRKLRWRAKNTGKSGGYRVIYYNQLDDGRIWLLLIYAKSAPENIPTSILKKIKETIENA